VEQVPPAPPWFLGNAWGPLNDAGSQAFVAWQDAQLVP
jgi:hypothetical protein